MRGEPQEALVDRLVREAIEAGEFDGLPGAGKPIPGAGGADDDNWWIREWVKRELAKDSDSNRPDTDSDDTDSEDTDTATDSSASE